MSESFCRYNYSLIVLPFFSIPLSFGPDSSVLVVFQFPICLTCKQICFPTCYLLSVKMLKIKIEFPFRIVHHFGVNYRGRKIKGLASIDIFNNGSRNLTVMAEFWTNREKSSAATFFSLVEGLGFVQKPRHNRKPSTLNQGEWFHYYRI